jgi:hypothetical protein
MRCPGSYSTSAAPSCVMCERVCVRVPPGTGVTNPCMTMHKAAHRLAGMQAGFMPVAVYTHHAVRTQWYRVGSGHMPASRQTHPQHTSTTHTSTGTPQWQACQTSDTRPGWPQWPQQLHNELQMAGTHSTTTVPEKRTRTQWRKGRHTCR